MKRKINQLSRLSYAIVATFRPKKTVIPKGLEIAKVKISSDDLLKAGSSRLNIAFKKFCINLHINSDNFKTI
ncbi:hypothetical protein NO89_11255 [Staphylococcus pseudintermedius]|nr:hypothetical protein NO89_11255 [Staphylococcus pseudintermedius]KZK24350.1 hypothetical protein NO88_02705 [Staphylococcus pseudintermedius]